MNYGPQSSDPWSWGTEDDSTAANNGGMNVQHPLSKPHPPERELPHNAGGWPQPGQQYHRPNGSLPQVPRNAQPHAHPHYNDPNASAPPGRNGADFFDSFVNSNPPPVSGWGPKNQWGPQNPPPPSNHLPAGSQAENNEIAPPETEQSRGPFPSTHPPVHPEKNSNSNLGDTANANVYHHHPTLGHPQLHAGSDNQEVPVAHGWNWGDSYSNEPTPPPPIAMAEPRGPLVSSPANDHLQSAQLSRQTYLENNQDIAQSWGWNEPTPPPVAKLENPAHTQNSLPMHQTMQRSQQPYQENNQEVSSQGWDSWGEPEKEPTPAPVKQSNSRRPNDQTLLANPHQRRIDPEGPSHYNNQSPRHHIQTASINSEKTVQPVSQRIPSPGPSSIKPSQLEPSNHIVNKKQPRSLENNSPLSQFSVQDSSNQQQSSVFSVKDPSIPQHSIGFVPSDPRENVSQGYCPPLSQNHKDAPPVPSRQFGSTDEMGNQAVPSPMRQVTERGQDAVDSNLPKPVNQGFTTPDSRNKNPFLDDTHSISSVHPIGSSTPTSLPYKPENEEVPSKPETIHQRMSALTIEEVIPNLDGVKHETQNQEAPAAKDPPLLVSDRNQYLETGHLSAPKDTEDTSLQDLADESDAPPPGLDRMVTGQQREPIATPSDMDIVSNAATAGSYILGASSTSSVVSEAEGRKDGSLEGEEVEPESQRLVQGESNAEEQSYLPGPTGLREVPGEAEPMRGRVVVGQMGRGPTPPLLQDQPSPRSDRVRSDQEIGERMVVGERTDSQQPNSQDDFRQQHRPRHRHPRGESSFDEEDREYSSDRDRRDRDRGEYKRDDRPRRRRDDRHRSPEYHSDEEYEDKRPYPRGNRERDRRDRRDRDREYSPDRDYYYRDRDYYHDPRDRRPRRYDRDREYHHRDREYEDDYYYRDHRSRPSSRTGSDYRRLNVGSDYAARSRHYYPDTRSNTTLPLKNASRNSSMLMNSSGFPDLSKVDPRSYGEYLETMRRVDPAGYALWYNNYMAARYNLHQSGTFNNDRASVHSGQSSSNQRQAVQSPTAAVDEDKEEDYTPRLYTTAHVRGTIDNYGRLLVVDPHYPMDGQRASISLYQMSSFPIPDADMEEFLEAPGPFIPGITHRSTVLHYLKRMSQSSQKNSEKLLYDLVHLIVKGNGEINGCDISELLMSSFKKCSYDEERRDGEGDGAISQTEVITRFRELLIQGNKLEALEWVIDRGAWGHALFLSSKMDPKTHKDVMFRFVDSISQNDPIRTLYQMMSGHIPHASECCGDKQWSDWRPHLAMILGNPTANSKIDRKSIIRLGDALSAKGRVFAAHFCYITAQVELTAYKPSAKLILLGANSKLDNPLLASCRSIMLTLCYEYGLKLKQLDFSIPSLQLYKLILTTRLIDIGKTKIALQYCQLMALEALQCGNYNRSVMSHVVDLASRLKMLEPSLALSGDVDAEPEWLEKLKAIYENLPEDYESRAELRPSASSSTISEAGQDLVTEPQQLQPIAEARNSITVTQPLYDPYAYNQELTVSSDSLHQPYVPHQLQLVSEEQEFNAGNVMNPPALSNHYMEPPPPMVSAQPTYGHEQNYWDNNANPGIMGSDNTALTNNSYDYPNPEAPSTPVKKNDFFKATEEQLKLTEVSNNAANGKAESTQPQQKQQSGDKLEDHKSGWFGGILDKLSMRPKNQMKLPDDRNPSIVWDNEKKKWVNLDGDSETQNAVKPPPKAFQMGGAVQPPNRLPSGGNPMQDGAPLVQNSGPTSLPQQPANKYKLQKGKLMKKNYVDIMSNNNNTSQSQPTSFDGYMPLVPPAPQLQPTFFTPSRVEGMDNAPYDFITPSSNPRLPESSTEDVPTQPQAAPAQAPMMYNRPLQ